MHVCGSLFLVCLFVFPPLEEQNVGTMAVPTAIVVSIESIAEQELG